MTYNVIYGDASSMASHDRHLGRVQTERFNTEDEALYRARELIDDDEVRVVAIRDDAGYQLTGVCLQLKLACCPI